jgi:hypothetical protein
MKEDINYHRRDDRLWRTPNIYDLPFYKQSKETMISAVNEWKKFKAHCYSVIELKSQLLHR